MKKILVTQRLILNKDYYELREALDVNWGILFEKINFLPIILPIEYNFEKYFKSIDIDGIILTGGNDLDIINKNEISKKRDLYEKNLIKYAIKNDIPVFGFCRGMQIIAEFFGADFYEVKNQINTKHKLKVNKDSKYFNLLNRIDKVNSFHNYGIKSISDDILISATNEDGIIKAIEHKKMNIFGQMWHTERGNEISEKELNLVRVFFND